MTKRAYRPRVAPVVLRKKCRSCRRDLGPQFFRQRNKSCNACLDNSAPPSEAENVTYVPWKLRGKRLSWPDFVVFEEVPARHVVIAIAMRCEQCGVFWEDVAVTARRRFCSAECRVKAHRARTKV